MYDEVTGDWEEGGDDVIGDWEAGGNAVDDGWEGAEESDGYCTADSEYGKQYDDDFEDTVEIVDDAVDVTDEPMEKEPRLLPKSIMNVKAPKRQGSTVLRQQQPVQKKSKTNGSRALQQISSTHSLLKSTILGGSLFKSSIAKPIQPLKNNTIEKKDKETTSIVVKQLPSKTSTVRSARELPSSFTGASNRMNGNSGTSTDTTNITNKVSSKVDAKLAMKAVMETMSNLKEGEMDVPERTMMTGLLKHQKMALSWMCKREEGEQVRGGILADDQGLGKTISTIALIVTNHPPLQQLMGNRRPASWKKNSEDDDDSDDALDPRKVPKTETAEINAKKMAEFKAGTLVVCPTAVLKQWESELTEKVHPHAGVTVHVYHGKNKAANACELSKFGVVVTSYGTLGMEAPPQPKKKKNKNYDGVFDYLDFAEDQNDQAKLKRKSGRNKDKTGPLFQVSWFRVILDEAQSIKNPGTLVTHAAWNLNAERRWCLSGTPVQNSIDDLFSYFKFLQYKPYDQPAAFKEIIKGGINGDEMLGYQRLQAILEGVLLRRTKGACIDGNPIINLPPRNLNLLKVEMDRNDRAFYNSVKKKTWGELQQLNLEGKGSYMNMLWVLLRLRQACCHPWLLEKTNMKSKKSGAPTKTQLGIVKKMKPNRRTDLLKALQELNCACPICCDLPEMPVTTPCGHIFCFQCVCGQLSASAGGPNETGGFCPVCGENLKQTELLTEEAFSKVLNSSQTCDDTEGTPHEWVSSTKIDQLIDLLSEIRHKSKNAQDSRKRDGGGLHGKSASDQMLANVFKKIPNASRMAGNVAMPEKVLVFSQWTSMLDVIEIPLKMNKFQYRRLDGRMTLSQRDKAISDFKSKPEVMVMLISLKAAAVGLNLTCANHVVLMDLWWNPTVEEQAIDRAHRIGQTRAVEVTRMVIKGTVEEAILALQEKKRGVISNALMENGQKNERSGQLTSDDLKFLFGCIGE